MKVTAPRTIVIQEDGQKPVRFTDPSKAAEHWARAKEQEWVEKNKDNPKYSLRGPGPAGRRYTYLRYDDGRARYRKLKRRALTIFRRIMNENEN